MHARSQAQLVDGLAAAGDATVWTPAVRAALRAVDRALFLDGDDYGEPYLAKPQPLGFGASLSAPQHHALVLSTVLSTGRLTPAARVLDVGCGSGYLTAALFAAAGTAATPAGSGCALVVGVDRVPALVDRARSCLARCPVTTRAVASGALRVEHAYAGSRAASGAASVSETWHVDAWTVRGGRFDVVHLGFALDLSTRGGRRDFDAVRSALLEAERGVVVGGIGGDLCVWGATGDPVAVAAVPGMAKAEAGPWVKPATRAERKSRLKAELERWRDAFAARNGGRRPTRTEMALDAEAAALFDEFRTL